MAKEKNKEKTVLYPKDDKEKEAYIKVAVDTINKTYGDGSIMKMGAKSAVPIDVIPTGCMTLDSALGIGGVPRGRIVEIYGAESSGKTTLALHIIAEAQKLNGKCVFIDAEHALDPIYAEKIGVDIKELMVSQPDNGEQALDIAEQLIRSGAVDVVVIDSVAALTPKAEIEGELGASVVGAHARLMSQAMRKLTGCINKSKTCVIFINQLREKVGGYGNPETTTGGKALKFYASVRIDVRRKDQIKSGEEIVGNITKATVVKNKCAPPFKVAMFTIRYGKGVDKEACVVDIGSKLNIINKSGSWFGYNGEKLGQGLERAAQYLRDNPALMKEIDTLVHEELRKGNTVDCSDETEPEGVVEDEEE